MLQDKNGQPIVVGTYACKTPDENSHYIVVKRGAHYRVQNLDGQDFLIVGEVDTTPGTLAACLLEPVDLSKDFRSTTTSFEEYKKRLITAFNKKPLDSD